MGGRLPAIPPDALYFRVLNLMNQAAAQQGQGSNQGGNQGGGPREHAEQ